ncbi:MAG: cysteine-rich CWC family protein [Perlabentimonas sp.]
MGVIRFKNCPRCNKLFDCYSDSSKECWCSNVKLSNKTLDILTREYSGCLCPECLKYMNLNATK